MSNLRRVPLLLAAVTLLSLLLCAPACGGGNDGSASIPDADPLAPDVEVGSLPYLAECNPSYSEECETGLCFNFNAHGAHCSMPCTTADDCPAPSSGCSGMGVCKGDW
jgi:hypothetical protein